MHLVNKFCNLLYTLPYGYLKKKQYKKLYCTCNLHINVFLILNRLIKETKSFKKALNG